MKKNLRALVLGALMVALATVLSFVSIKMPSWSFGGSITLGSMVPLILFAILCGSRWGLLASTAYGLIQMLLGFYAPPAKTVLAFFLVIMLDYIIAFGAMGFAGWFNNLFAKLRFPASLSAVCAAALCVILRFICHFLSGILVWQAYAPEDMPVWLYSFVYNGGYMAGELIITCVIVLFLYPALKKILKTQHQI